MFLHEAIYKLLKESGGSMTTSEIAGKLNQLGWYQKNDGTPITAYQIHGRTAKYQELFERDGTLVTIKGKGFEKPLTKIYRTALPTKLNEIKGNIDLLIKVLLNQTNLKKASAIDSIVSESPGLYCIRVKKTEVLPEPFSHILKNRGHNIIYIGIASQSLKKRFLNQELRANGHGTFFRSIGAVLGYKPIPGSLKNKSNKKNYKFPKDSEEEIIKWINSNLLVNWVERSIGLKEIESNLIKEQLPLLNLDKNPLALMELSELRAECVRIANS